jgi:hypothetical protein
MSAGGFLKSRDIHCTAASALLLLGSFLAFVYRVALRRRITYNEEQSGGKFGAFETSLLISTWHARFDLQWLLSTAVFVNACAWVVFSIVIIKLTWVLRCKGKYSLGSTVTIAVLAVGGGVAEFLASLLCLGANRAMSDISNRYELNTWIQLRGSGFDRSESLGSALVGDAAPADDAAAATDETRLTDAPTDAPADVPSFAPTDFEIDAVPSFAPTDVQIDAVPSFDPTDVQINGVPSFAPTDVLIDGPTNTPTDAPTFAPTISPTGPYTPDRLLTNNFDISAYNVNDDDEKGDYYIDGDESNNKYDGDGLGWKSLELLHAVSNGLVSFIDAIEYLFISAILFMTFCAVLRKGRAVFSMSWAIFGLLVAAMSLAQFLTTVLAFDTFSPLRPYSNALLLINQVCLLPIWVFWLGRQLKEAQDGMKYRLWETTKP